MEFLHLEILLEVGGGILPGWVVPVYHCVALPCPHSTYPQRAGCVMDSTFLLVRYTPFCGCSRYPGCRIAHYPLRRVVTLVLFFGLFPGSLRFLTAFPRFYTVLDLFVR